MVHSRIYPENTFVYNTNIGQIIILKLDLLATKSNFLVSGAGESEGLIDGYRVLW